MWTILPRYHYSLAFWSSHQTAMTWTPGLRLIELFMQEDKSVFDFEEPALATMFEESPSYKILLLVS